MDYDTYRIIFNHIKDLLDNQRFYVVTDRYPPGNPINYGRRYVEIYAYKHADGPNPKPRSIYSNNISNIRIRIYALSVSVETWLDRPPESWLINSESEKEARRAAYEAYTQMTGMAGYMLRDQLELDLNDPLVLDTIKDIIWKI